VLLAASIVGLFVLDEPLNLILFGIAALVEVGEIYLWTRFLERYRVRGGAEGMVGERATVLETCDPVGLARVRGEIWKARAEESDPLSPGERATVERVEGLSVRIRRERSRN
jgi:membrane protein implicated in regulation of membrane protease activity